MTARRLAHVALLSLAAVMTTSCDPVEGMGFDCKHGTYRCHNDSVQYCSGGAWATLETCGGSSVCDPNTHHCTR